MKSVSSRRCRLQVLCIVLSVVCASVLEHLVDATFLERDLTHSQRQPCSYWQHLDTRLTERQALYCLKSGSHSSVFAVPRRYSGRMNRQYLLAVDFVRVWRTFAVPLQKARIVAASACQIWSREGISSAHSLSSLHSGASDSDMIGLDDRKRVYE